MSTFHGRSGQVYVSSNQVAEVNEFTLDIQAEFADDSQLSDQDKTTHADPIRSWRGTVSCWWDDTDTNGQEALDAGNSVTLNLRHEGTGSGLSQFSGTARITGESITTSKGGINQRTFTFEGSGALSRTVQ